MPYGLSKPPGVDLQARTALSLGTSKRVDRPAVVDARRWGPLGREITTPAEDAISAGERVTAGERASAECVGLAARPRIRPVN